MVFSWHLQAKGLPALFASNPDLLAWVSWGKQAPYSAHLCLDKDGGLSLHGEPLLFSGDGSRELVTVPQEDLFEAHSKGPLTIGCKYKKSYQTLEIQEDHGSFVGPPPEEQGCYELFPSRAVPNAGAAAPRRACGAGVIKTRKPAAAPALYTVTRGTNESATLDDT